MLRRSHEYQNDKGMKTSGKRKLGPLDFQANARKIRVSALDHRQLPFGKYFHRGAVANAAARPAIWSRASRVRSILRKGAVLRASASESWLQSSSGSASRRAIVSSPMFPPKACGSTSMVSRCSMILFCSFLKARKAGAARTRWSGETA
jgi:hypothetical protein